MLFVKQYHVTQVWGGNRIFIQWKQGLFRGREGQIWMKAPTMAGTEMAAKHARQKLEKIF